MTYTGIGQDHLSMRPDEFNRLLVFTTYTLPCLWLMMDHILTSSAILLLRHDLAEQFARVKSCRQNKPTHQVVLNEEHNIRTDERPSRWNKEPVVSWWSHICVRPCFLHYNIMSSMNFEQLWSTASQTENQHWCMESTTAKRCTNFEPQQLRRGVCKHCFRKAEQHEEDQDEIKRRLADEDLSSRSSHST